ncbi:MAG: type II toxin-antitoxin system antitoxin SocA domain-containing protein [Pseudomonadota bacterium]
MLNVHNVAKYFLLKGDNEEESGICNLKLQKLLYYAQGFYLALFEQPLFDSKIEAWRHGPVCPEVYHKYKNHGRNLIPAPPDFNPTSVLSHEQIEFLDEVYDVFGQFSAWKLRNMTHDEPPWAGNEINASEISVDELADYFKTRVK